MKKLLGIVVLGLFLSGNAYSAGVITLYCDSPVWNNYITLNVNYDLNIVQHPNFKEGNAFKAKISEKSIFFIDQDGEHWTINRTNGILHRKSFKYDIDQRAKCSTNKPKIKQKF